MPAKLLLRIPGVVPGAPVNRKSTRIALSPHLRPIQNHTPSLQGNP